MHSDIVTLMIKNVPASYNSKALLQELHEYCDLRYCDMLHLPIDTKRRCNVGYAFVNFTLALAAQRCVKNMSGRSWSLAHSRKCCVIVAAHHQGLSANLANFVENNEMSRFQPPYAPRVFSNCQPLTFVDAVREHCDESVVQVLLRKCWDFGERDRGAPAHDGKRCRQSRVVDHSASAPQVFPAVLSQAVEPTRAVSMEGVAYRDVSVQANPLCAGRMSRSHADVVERRPRAVLRISL